MFYFYRRKTMTHKKFLLIIPLFLFHYPMHSMGEKKTSQVLIPNPGEKKTTRLLANTTNHPKPAPNSIRFNN